MAGPSSLASGCPHPPRLPLAALAGGLLGLVVSLPLLPGCRSMDREVELKRASIAQLPKEHQPALAKLIPFALKRSVKIKPAMFKVGSGSVISPDGWIVTAEHVVRGEETVDVIFEDGVSLTGRVMALAYGNDYALVKVEAQNLPFFQTGSRPKLGDWVGAFGSAYRQDPDDHDGSVSVGRCIYPQVRIPGEVGTYYYDAVFHSAPIFPGDSGGPLTTLDGRLIGIHGGFAAENASVAPSIQQVAGRIRAANGALDPAGALRGKALPVRWPADKPKSFDESTRWTTASVLDTLIEVYAPGERGFVEDLLKSIRARYLTLRASDDRSDDELIRAMLADVFEVLRARQKSGNKKRPRVRARPSRDRSLPQRAQRAQRRGSPGWRSASSVDSVSSVTSVAAAGSTR